MLCKIFFAPNSLIFRKSCGEKEEDGENRKRFAFEANTPKKVFKSDQTASKAEANKKDYQIKKANLNQPVRLKVKHLQL